MKIDYEKRIKNLKFCYEESRKRTKEIMDKTSKLIEIKGLTNQTYDDVLKLTEERWRLADEQSALLREIHRLEDLKWKDGIVA